MLFNLKRIIQEATKYVPLWILNGKRGVFNVIFENLATLTENFTHSKNAGLLKNY